MKKLLPLAVLIISTLWFAACGSSNNSGLPPVNGGGNNGYSAASLAGTWVFTVRGSDYTGDVFSAIGVFTADGNGKITGGLQDVSDLANGFSQQIPFTGGYAVNSDGRGQAQFNYSGNNGFTQLRFVFTSSGAGRIIELSNSEDATGTLLKQTATPSAIMTPFPGPYVLRLDGYAQNGRRAEVGLIQANNGTLTFTFDENYNGAFTGAAQLSGALTVDSNGRGTVTLGGRNFVFYIVSESHAEFLETTNNTTASGSAERQDAGFIITSLIGNYVFGVSGVSISGSNYVPVNEAGRATLNGAGSVTSGVRDYNENANLTNSTPVGSYAVDSNTGHFTLTLTNGSGTTYDSFSGYLINNGWGVMLTNAGPITSGTIRQQTGSPSTATLNGYYGLQFSGVNWNTGNNLEWISAVHFDGAGNLTGTADYTTAGTLSPNVKVNGTYNLDANGRVTATINSVPYVIYDVDGTQAFILSTDASRQYQGNMVQQPAQ